MGRHISELLQIRVGSGKAFRLFGQSIFRKLPLRDIARNLRCANDFAVRIEYGRDSQRYLQELAILGAPYGFVVVHAPALSDLVKDSKHFVAAAGGRKNRYGLANGFLGGVAKNSFCRFIPGGNDAIEIFADDGVVGGLDNRSEQPASLDVRF
ncbi:MAG: hypothetical protein ABSH32_29420 [Bryobacteraceae bacterium]